MMRRLLQRIRGWTSGRFVRDTRGAAAVELAIITPAILGLFFGTAELADGVAVDRKVTITARSLSDLVSQYDTLITNAAMTNVLNATTAIMTPYAASPLKIKVSAVNIDASGNAKVAWGDAANDTARNPNDTVTIPTALKIPNTQLIWSEISYAYTPTVAKYITGSLTLTEQFFARPRQSSTICRVPTGTTCP